VTQATQQPPLLTISPTKSAFSDAAASDNKTLPLHRWVPWIAGFSAKFVEDAIDAYLPKRNRDRRLVLDPFAGVGTTLVEALKAGCPTVGFEINPFATLAARAKVNCINVLPESFESKLMAFETRMREFEEDVDSRWVSGAASSLEDVLRPLRPNGPRTFRSRVTFFSPPIEAKFLYALALVAAEPAMYRDLFRAALGATMVSFSNYSYEPSLSSRPGAGKPLIENASVAHIICVKLRTMLEDVRWARSSHGAVWRHLRRDVRQCSYFSADLSPKSVSLVVTSPPYMNNYHYVRNTRPQLHWLGLIGDNHELAAYERESFGKFWQTVREEEPVRRTFVLPELAQLVGSLRELNVERGPYGGPGWANYVTTYFNDCWRFLRVLKRHLRPGGVAVVVVGNSIIQGIEFKVDALLGQLAEVRGLKVEEIRVVRTKRVGSSIIDSSVRNGGGQRKQPTQLYDAAVILRR
jgi:SAM-dependent methyltransferase